MNIVQLHERVRFWTDVVGSPRFEQSDIDNAVNIAMNNIVEQKYAPTRLAGSGDSFQRSQKIRDELSALVKESDSSVAGQITFISSVGNSIIPIASFPADYKYLLAIALYSIVGEQYNCWPITYDRINVIGGNPYRRPRQFPISKQYYIESDAGIKLVHNIIPAPAKAVIHYLSTPIQWSCGPDYTGPLDNGFQLIATSETVVYNGVTYLRGDPITISGELFLTSGTVVKNYTNSNINVSLHEEIARKASVNLLLSIKEFDKAKAIVEYFI